MINNLKQTNLFLKIIIYLNQFNLKMFPLKNYKSQNKIHKINKMILTLNLNVKFVMKLLKIIEKIKKLNF